MKVLVIQTAFLGDAVLATAVTETLIGAIPDCELHFLVRRGYESLFADHPYLRKVLIWDKNQRKYSRLIELIRIIRSEHYDAVINLQRYAATGLMTGLSRARIRSGFRTNPLSILFTHRAEHAMNGNLHETERNHILLRPIVGPGAKLRLPALFPSATDVEIAAELAKEPFVTISPASVWHTKQWPAEKWAKLADLTANRNRVLLLGSGSDGQVCELVSSLCLKARPIILAGKLTLLQTSALMRKATMNYTNDSGPLHMASAVGASVTAVFCSTVPEFGFGPAHAEGRVIESDAPLRCRPCGLHGRRSCPEGHFLCAYAIDPKNVIVPQ